MSPDRTLENNLKQILPPDHIVPPEARAPVRVTVIPQEVEQICELVTLARKTGITLLPVGGTTHMYPAAQPLDVGVSLSQLDGNIQHNPDDLTATASAGTPFPVVQEKLAEQGQTLPLDSPPDERSTLGGVISTNHYGPRVHRYGTARDWVVGTRVVNGHGQLSRAGGKVVKNVSGYDLNKLYVGSRGTLGIVVEVSLKLHPLPQARSIWGVRSPRVADLMALAASLRRSGFAVEAAAILRENRTDDNPGMWSLLVAMSGSTSTLPEQEASVKSHLEGYTAAYSVHRDEAQSMWIRMEKDFTEENPSLVTVAKVSLGIKGLKTFLQDDLFAGDSGLIVRAYPSAGVCHIGFSSRNETPSGPVERTVNTVRQLGGFIEFTLLPPDSSRDRWPIVPSSLPWMKQIKTALDPDGVFAPGTFVGGI